MKNYLAQSIIFILTMVILVGCENKNNPKEKDLDPNTFSKENDSAIKSQTEEEEDMNDRPVFATTGKSVKSFVPSDYEIDLQSKGDLNLDGLEDIIIVLVSTYDKTAPRPTLVLLQQPDHTYKLDKVSWTALESKYDSDNFDYPRYEQEEISIDSSGVFQHHIWNLGPNINQTALYKYIDNELCLIYIDAFGGGAGSQTYIDFDLLNSELSITEVNTMKEDMPSTTKNKIYKIPRVLFESASPIKIISEMYEKFNL